MSFDQSFWEQRWAEVQRDHGDMLATKSPSPYVTELAEGLSPGRALDAGCGHGAETLWLAARGWRVTAVDFSATALGIGRSMADALGVAERVDWVQADLAGWVPTSAQFDLVVSLYVHVDGDVTEAVARLADGVAPGGTLLMVGHQGIEQTQVSVDAAVAALDGWRIDVAEERDRPAGGTDAVIVAVRPAG